MRALAAGIDDRPVEPDREEKSISAEETFAVDIRDRAELERQLMSLADRTASRLRAHALMAGKVTVKIRRHDFTTFTRQRGVAPPTQETAAIARIGRELLGEWLRSQTNIAVRLLGIGVGTSRCCGRPICSPARTRRRGWTQPSTASAAASETRC